MTDEFRKREAILTGTDPGPTPSPTTEKGGNHVYVYGGGGDGTEPEHSRWAFFTAPRISLFGAMIYVTIGILIGSILSANAGDGCPKGTQFYCWTDPVTLVMHCSCS